MSEAMLLKCGTEFLIGAAVLTTAVWLYLQKDGNGANWATILQTPADNDVSVQVKHWGDFTIIERHDHNGNNATIIQQGHDPRLSE
jgi:hypothetical protein